MKQFRIRNSLLCICLVLIMVVPVHAADTKEAQSKVKSASDRLNQLQNSRSDLESYMSALGKQLTEIQDELDQLELQQEEKALEIEYTQNDLAAAIQQEEDQFESMKKRIKYIYENGETNLLSILFGAESMSDLLNKLDFVNQISQYDRDMLISYQETKDLIAATELRLEQEKEELEELYTQAAEQQNTVSLLLAQAEKELLEFDTDIASAQKQLADYQNELKKQEEEIEAQKKLEAQRKAEAENKVSNTGNPGTSGNNTGNSGNGGSNGGNDKTPDNPDDNNSGGTDLSSYSDVQLLAAMIQCEAGSEPWDGKIAVGNVIMNRVNSASFPGTVYGVLTQPYQFSPYTSGRFAQVLASGANSTCVNAANSVMAGENTAGNCLYFRTVSSAQSIGWDVDNLLVIGNHVFK